MVRLVVAALLSVTLMGCQGEQGPAGAPEGAVSNRYCRRSENNYFYQYQVVRFTSGDVEAICSVADVAAQHSSTIYYRSGDTGTTTAECWLYYDVDTVSGGYWDFRADAPGERATYYDATSGSNGFVMTFAVGDCSG